VQTKATQLAASDGNFIRCYYRWAMESVSTSRAEDWPHQVGRYEIVGRLATGGMAEILLGRLTGPAGFERPVVVKRILPHLQRRPEFARMLIDEARIAAQIRSDNVVQVHELGQEEHELFIVQEYLEGESAFGLLRRLVRSKRQLSPAMAAAIIADVCAGLQAAHELTDVDGEPLGVVHRDVSPENVFITYRGGVKLLDFGVALARDRVAQTETGNIKGKFGYMSPEQCRGQPLDARSDLFSVGVVLYELVLGARLFKRPNALAAVQAICDEPILPLIETRPDCPIALSRICARALDRSPATRYGSAAELRDDLLRIVRAAGTEDPVRDRAALMNELFQDRIAEKRVMLERLAGSGSHTPPPIPKPEADLDVEVPTVVRASARRRSYGLLAGIGLAVGVASSLLFVLVTRVSRPAQASRPAPIVVEPATEPATPTLELPAPAALASPTPSRAAAKVKVAVTSEPSGARVVVDGQDRGATPLNLELPQSASVAHLSLRHAGYPLATRDVVPTHDQAVRVTLERGHVAPPPSTSRFHRF
jgi:eukaryotic-like serine/threonine-protein kinase